MHTWRATALALGLAVQLSPTSAHALDAFEIEVYDGTANAPRDFSVELHLNHYAAGPGANDGTELALRAQTHFTLEPSFGLFRWWEVGGYLQAAERADGHFDFAGAKLRSKFVTTTAFQSTFDWAPTWSFRGAETSTKRRVGRPASPNPRLGGRPLARRRESRFLACRCRART